MDERWGCYKVQTFYSGSLGGERESIEAVQLGTQELTMSSTGPVPNFVPETKILDVPFLFRDKAHARAVLDGPIGQEMLAKFEPKGFYLGKNLSLGINIFVLIFIIIAFVFIKFSFFIFFVIFVYSFIIRWA